MLRQSEPQTLRDKSAQPKVDVKKQTDPIRFERGRHPNLDPNPPLHDKLPPNDPRLAVHLLRDVANRGLGPLRHHNKAALIHLS
jgi:hypothetical protein